jgi:hypothetical protein
MIKTSYPKLHSIKFKSGMFADNVAIMPLEYFKDYEVQPINVLEGAIMENLDHVVVAGYDKSGKEYFAGTYRDNNEKAALYMKAFLYMVKI